MSNLLGTFKNQGLGKKESEVGKVEGGAESRKEEALSGMARGCQGYPECESIPKAPIYFMPTCGRVKKEKRARARVAGWRGGAQRPPAERAAGRRAQGPPSSREAVQRAGREVAATTAGLPQAFPPGS